jgi:hypothetical protein
VNKYLPYFFIFSTITFAQNIPSNLFSENNEIILYNNDKFYTIYDNLIIKDILTHSDKSDTKHTAYYAIGSGYEEGPTSYFFITDLNKDELLAKQNVLNKTWLNSNIKNVVIPINLNKIEKIKKIMQRYNSDYLSDRFNSKTLPTKIKDNQYFNIKNNEIEYTIRISDQKNTVYIQKDNTLVKRKDAYFFYEYSKKYNGNIIKSALLVSQKINEDLYIVVDNIKILWNENMDGFGYLHYSDNNKIKLSLPYKTSEDINLVYATSLDELYKILGF